MRGWHLTLLRRELRSGAAQLGLFAFCVFLAALAVSVSIGWRTTVERAMDSENKKSAGGDVVAFSTEPFGKALLKAAAPHGGIRTTEMFTVALAPKTDLTLFSKLKAVEKGYPLYGALPLASGRDLDAVIRDGVVVEARVLERLGLKLGDEVKVGTRVFPIVDVALSEPDRPMGMFGVSPRIFIAHDLLESLVWCGRAAISSVVFISVSQTRPRQSPSLSNCERLRYPIRSEWRPGRGLP